MEYDGLDNLSNDSDISESAEPTAELSNDTGGGQDATDTIEDIIDTDSDVGNSENTDSENILDSDTDSVPGNELDTDTTQDNVYVDENGIQYLTGNFEITDSTVNFSGTVSGNGITINSANINGMDELITGVKTVGLLLTTVIFIMLAEFAIKHIQSVFRKVRNME